ncbi:MAG: serine/threonine-protein kinase [Myxococcota bacterium]
MSSDDTKGPPFSSAQERATKRPARPRQDIAHQPTLPASAILQDSPPEPRTTLRSVRRAVALEPIGRFGPYDILGRLALGGMAEILLARHRDQKVGRPVVLKKILAHFSEEREFLDMFQDEARIGLLLKHPNIVRFHDAGAVDGQHYIEMEWVDGQPLGRLIRRARDHDGVPMELAVAIAARVADALDYAHALREENGRPMGLIHRDVSPHNVIVGFDGEVKLLDFGIAKADTQHHRTQAGVVKGKFSYMAPEQCAGHEIDHRIDVFALGIVLYESLTGYVLYRRDSEAATMQAIVSAPVPTLGERLSNPPPELDAIIQKALAKSASDRYTTIGEMRDDLHRFLVGRGKTVAKQDIGLLMRRCFPDELERGPRMDSTPFGSSQLVSLVDEQDVRPTMDVKMPSGARDLDLSHPLGQLPDVPHPAGPDLVSLAPMPDEAPPLPADSLPLELEPVARPQRPRPAPAPSKGPPWILIGAIGLIALVGTAVAIWKPWASAPPPVEDPAPVVAEDPTTATLLVASVPVGALVSIGDHAMGPAPIEVRDLEPGEYTVRVEMAGYETFLQQVELAASDSELITARLLEATDVDLNDERGRLTLQTTPTGTEVFIGERSLGRTPLRQVRVPLGNYPIRLVMPHGEDRRARVMVTEGSETRLSIDVVALPE